MEDTQTTHNHTRTRKTHTDSFSYIQKKRNILKVLGNVICKRLNTFNVEKLYIPTSLTGKLTNLFKYINTLHYIEENQEV